jgi:outer membrane protein assembly factor BamB
MSANNRHRLVAALVLALLGGLASVAPGADWPQFRGPSRDGTSAEKGLLATWPEKGPPLVWDMEVGEGYSGPVVAGGRLILFHRLGDQEVVQCLDAANRKKRWKYSYATAYKDDYGKGDGPRSTPVIAGKRVHTLGAGGLLLCLGLEDGKKVWARALHEDYQVKKNFFGVGATPLVEGELVLVNVGAKGAGIVAFARDTGKEVWKATDAGASYASPVAATIGGVRHAIFFTREGVVSLDPKNGKVRFQKRWRSRNAASVNAATPVVVKDHVFISASYDTGAVLLKVGKDSAKEVWSGDEALSSHYETSVHHNGFLYGFDGRQESGARLRCVEFKTGKVRWTKEGFGCGSVILADGKLIILTENGDLVLAEPTPAAYREKARASVLSSPCRAPLALANGLLYLRDDKKLLCLNLKKK